MIVLFLDFYKDIGNSFQFIKIFFLIILFIFLQFIAHKKQIQKIRQKETQQELLLCK